MPESAYDAGYTIGTLMKEQRDEGDSSYDCRWDLADAAREGDEYFKPFKQGLEDGLDGVDRSGLRLD